MISRLVLWIAAPVAAVPLAIAIYVALFEQQPFNWPVAGVFAAVGFAILLIGWMISRLSKRS